MTTESQAALYQPPGTPDFRIHFRWHDSIDALIGVERYRYEVHTYKDIPELVKSLAPKGMDDFAWRKLYSIDAWTEIPYAEVAMFISDNTLKGWI